MAELAFEVFCLAKETTRGTIVTPPTHRFPAKTRSIKASNERYRSEGSGGSLGKYRKGRSKITQWNGDIDLGGDLDDKYALFLLNMAVRGGVTTPTTPTGATTARLFTFTRSMLADTLWSATAYAGDPNVAVWQSPYAMLESLVLTADSSGSDAATYTAKGWGQKPIALSGGAIPTIPAIVDGEFFIPKDMDMWLDTGVSSIGTTKITDRLVSSELTIPTGLVRKPGAKGAGGDRSFRRVGIQPVNPEAKIGFELVDLAQWTVYANDTYAKLRVRINGDKIEESTVNGADPFYRYIEYDLYGKLDAPDWGELEGTNRTITFTVAGEEEPVVGTDLTVRVQTTNTTV